MAIKWVPILVLLVLLSLECGLGFAEKSEENPALSARERQTRQSNCYYRYSYGKYYCTYSYYNYNSGYYSGSTGLSSGLYVAFGIGSFVVFCLPCIIVGVVICCCLCIPGCILSSQRNHNQVLTTTTMTTEPAKYEQPAYPQYPQTYPPTGVYPQQGYPQQGYAPPPQGYYPGTAPAQPYVGQSDAPVKYEGGYDPTAHPGYTAYPTDQLPPSYTATAQQPPPLNPDQPQTHGVGFET